jgi:endonuclease YncB( thermonuclease family)
MAARTALAALLEGKPVTVRPTRAWPDKYGRLLGRISVNGIDATLWMIKNGYGKRYSAAVHRALAVVAARKAQHK